MEKVTVVGIDPGVNTGVAVYDRETGKIIRVHMGDFWQTYEHITSNFGWKYTIIVIEAPVKSAMYARQEENAERGKRYGNRMMSNAASNAREAELLADGLEKWGFEVRRVRPTRRNFEKAEDDVKHVQRITGFMERTNAHTRDAIMLAWGV